MTANPSSNTTPTIVIFDDDKLSTHNLALQFRFMGEQPRCMSSDNWRTLLQNLKASDEYSNLLAVVVGQITRCYRKDLMAALQDYDARLPLLVLDDKTAEADPDASSVAQAAGDTPGQFRLPSARALTYENLSQALEEAAVFSGRQRQQPASAIISPGGSALFRSLSGSNPRIEQLRELIPQVAKRDVTVMILGESGTGKEVVARNLHYHSGRGSKPFVAVNCAALGPANMSAELFGCEELVNGQSRVQQGLLEQAAGGTVFFDQISELPMTLQAVLLRVLEDRQFQRIGGYQYVSTDVRVVVGSRHPLEALIAEEKFRKDLYYRLNTMPLHVPPLRERVEDIPELISELIARLESNGYQAIRLNSSAVQSLQRHDWPGNVRELANLIERLGIIQPGEVTGMQDLPALYQYPEPEVAANLPDEESGQVTQDGGVSPPYDPNNAAVPDMPQVQATLVYTRGPHPGPGGLMHPLDTARVEHYLASFERQMLQTALDDCAGILEFTAERLALDEAALKARLQFHSLGV